MSQQPPEQPPGGYGPPPAGGYGPPPGGYGAPQEPGYGWGKQDSPGGFAGMPQYPTGGSNTPPPAQIPNYLWQSIVVTVLCCIPFGIVAIVNATRVQPRQLLGDIPGALAASQRAKTWCIVSFIVGLIFNAVYLALVVSGEWEFTTTSS
ncbi:MAG: CD225/dispanin family protein [Frankia sp.]|nr:CD225/dispanin family protein [Frankia sp.]